MVRCWIYSGSKAKRVSWPTGCIMGEQEQLLMTPRCSGNKLGLFFAEMAKTVAGAGLGGGGEWALGVGHVAFEGSVRYPSGPVTRTSWSRHLKS